jgi:predicted transcriptional regulator
MKKYKTLSLNQTQLSKRCNVSQQPVSNWMNGPLSPSLNSQRILRKLAAASSLNLEIKRLQYD